MFEDWYAYKVNRWSKSSRIVLKYFKIYINIYILKFMQKYICPPDDLCDVICKGLQYKSLFYAFMIIKMQRIWEYVHTSLFPSLFTTAKMKTIWPVKILTTWTTWNEVSQFLFLDGVTRYVSVSAGSAFNYYEHKSGLFDWIIRCALSLTRVTNFDVALWKEGEWSDRQFVLSWL